MNTTGITYKSYNRLNRTTQGNGQCKQDHRSEEALPSGPHNHQARLWYVLLYGGKKFNKNYKVTSKQLISELRNRTVNTWYFTIFYSLFFHAHFLQTA